MAVKALVLAVAILIPLPTFAGVNPDGDIENLAAAFPSASDGLMRYGRHLRLRGPALLKYSNHLRHGHVHLRHGGRASQMAKLEAKLAAEVEADLASDAHAGTSDAAPIPKTSRQRLLAEASPADLEDLRFKELVARQARGELEGTVNDAARHLNDAAAIKRDMRKKAADVRRESGELNKLEEDAGRLGQTRRNLASSLEHIMVPKLLRAQDRLEKKEAVLRKEDYVVQAWRSKSLQLKESAIEHIKKKKASQQEVADAEAAVADAKKKEDVARIEYKHISAQTGDEIQKYRIVTTRFKAAEQHEDAAKRVADAARESIARLSAAFEKEQQKIEQTIGFREQKLQQKMSEIESERRKSSDELTNLKLQYKEWEQLQRARTAEAEKRKMVSEAASEDVAAKRKHVLEAKGTKAARGNETAGDWAWAARVADELDDDEPDIQFSDDEFEDDWNNEWRNGDFPSYKETYSRDTFPGRKAIVEAEDEQSDGKASAALSGPNVGAYLKHSPDGTIKR